MSEAQPGDENRPVPKPPMENPDETLVSRYRTRLGQLVGLFIFLYVVLVAPPTMFPAWTGLAFESLGFVLLAAAAFGRLWCLVFIAGSKDKVLQREGPYSVVRNPLYFFSFLGAIGFGLVTRNPFLSVFLAGAFTFQYAVTVKTEEAHLRRLFGEDFSRYVAQVPRWFPNWSLYREPARLSVDARRIREGMLDAMWFLWAYLFWQVLDTLREMGVVSTLA